LSPAVLDGDQHPLRVGAVAATRSRHTYQTLTGC
jgi:hypothetical protein